MLSVVRDQSITLLVNEAIQKLLADSKDELPPLISESFPPD